MTVPEEANDSSSVDSGSMVPDDEMVWAMVPEVAVTVRSVAAALALDFVDERYTSQPPTTSSTATGSTTAGLRISLRAFSGTGPPRGGGSSGSIPPCPAPSMRARPTQLLRAPWRLADSVGRAGDAGSHLPGTWRSPPANLARGNFGR